MRRNVIFGLLFAVFLTVTLFYATRPSPPAPVDPGAAAYASPGDAYDGTSRGLIEAALVAHGLAGRESDIPGVMTESVVTLLGDAPDREAHSVEWYRFPDRVRVDFRIGRGGAIYIYDGLHGWSLRNRVVAETSDQLTESLRRNIKVRPAWLLPVALDERSLLGPVVADSAGSLALLTVTLTDPEGDQTRIAVDAESFLLTRVDYALFSSAGVDSMQLTWRDYEEVDGIRTAREASILRNGVKVQQNRIETTEYSPDLPDSLFVRPKAPAPPTPEAG